VSTKTISAAIAAILTTAAIAGQAQGWGAAHAGYTHVGPNGVQHASYNAAAGPGGYGSSAHVSSYGSNNAYHASYGTAYHASGTSGGAYHSYSTQSGGYAVGGYHSSSTISAGVYRGY
jgi:hypothetical protein